MRSTFAAIVIAVLSGVALAPAQTRSSDSRITNFAINPKKPWAYIEFVKTGSRNPRPGEPDTGVWLRLVNNSRLSIGLTTVGSGDDLLVEHDVVYHEVVLVSYISGEPPKPAPTPRSEMPNGYTFEGAVSWLVIQPGEGVQFSIPINHISEDWYINVPFEFMLDGSPTYLRQPSLKVSFSTMDIPNNERSKFDIRTR